MAASGTIILPQSVRNVNESGLWQKIAPEAGISSPAPDALGFIWKQKK